MDFTPLASGSYLEGLAIDQDAIWFSDVTGGGIYRLSGGGAIDAYLEDQRFLAALTLNHDGRLIYSGGHGLNWLDPDSGETGVLLNAIDGEPLLGVNEMTPDGQGGLYFGVIDLVSIAKGEKPKPSSICQISADGAARKLVDGLAFSNGLGLSPDGRTLYHNESFVGVSSYPVNADGSLGAGKRLLDKPDCDGMAIDVEGGAWVSGFRSDALIRIRPDGKTESVKLPGEGCTNVRFGGEDGRDLFVHGVTLESVDAIVAGAMPKDKSAVLYCARMPVAGQAIEPTRFKLK